MTALKSLWPREHGAYAQLAVPLTGALVVRPPTVAAIAIALASCLAFLANEPLLVVLGHRGARAQRELGDRAKRRLALLAAGAAVAAAAGLALASSATLAIAALVALPAAVMVALAWTRSAHSLAGELVAAVALPGASAPVAVACGVPWATALELWLAWSLGYASAVIAVHYVLERRRRGGPLRYVTVGLLVPAVVGLVTALPLALTSAVIAIASPSPRRLRMIGVVYVAASFAAGALAVQTMRA